MVPKGKTAAQSRLPGILSFLVLCIILCLGLWPLHIPANDVKWLGSRNGLRLGRYATLISDGPLGTPGTAGSVEIWLQPAHLDAHGTILSVSQPGYAAGFRIRQSLTDIVVETVSPGRKEKFFADEVIRANQPYFLTVTSGVSGTVVYLDGVPARKAPLHISPQDFAGQLILADTPRDPDSWEGRVYGVAVYRRELTEAETAWHYRSWAETGRPEIQAADDCAALYLLDERSGAVAHNQIGPAGALRIPGKYEVAGHEFLQPFWEEFSLSREYFNATAKNVVGFLPVGFVFYAYLAGIRGVRRSVPLVILLGLLISLTIELLQYFLPNRDSGTSDLITNTFGTWMGVLLYRQLYARLAVTFPWLPLFPKPRG